MDAVLTYIERAAMKKSPVHVYRIGRSYPTTQLMQNALKALNETPIEETEKLLIYIAEENKKDQLYCLKTMSRRFSLKEVSSFGR